jgi:hypothetical protein
VSRVVSEFKKLSPARQVGILAITAWNLGLSVAAEWDIQHRPAAQVRGSKAFWRLACLINTAGPLSYPPLGPTQRRPMPLGVTHIPGARACSAI